LDESSINIDGCERLQDIGVQALTVHARTRAQMYKGHSDWTHIERVKTILNYDANFLETAISILQKSIRI
jgi:tRNA-dihydrouridine synthase